MNAPRLAEQLERMDQARRARRARVRFTDERITLSHGAGGKASYQLIEGLIRPAFDATGGAVADAAVCALRQGTDRIAFTTDTYVVSPLFFPGGDIGALAVHGTINDLAMAGADPLCLSVALILEEGLEVAVLRRVVQSLASAARAAGVPVVTGDTKVVPRGKADGLFINTSGVGVMRGAELSATAIQAGDAVLVSGYLGDHGMAVMLARDALELEAEIVTDSAPLHVLARAVLEAAPHARVLRDPTRGGVATVLNELALQAGGDVGFAVDEARVPVRPEVRAACEILGIDPLHIANEGKLIAVVPREEAAAALAALRADPLGRVAEVIGEATADPDGLVVVKTGVGGSRVLDMLVGDPLPRIC
jgi:hydrogenase expression/formation protein HypE